MLWGKNVNKDWPIPGGLSLSSAISSITRCPRPVQLRPFTLNSQVHLLAKERHDSDVGARRWAVHIAGPQTGTLVDPRKGECWPVFPSFRSTVKLTYTWPKWFLSKKKPFSIRTPGPSTGRRLLLLISWNFLWLFTFKRGNLADFKALLPVVFANYSQSKFKKPWKSLPYGCIDLYISLHWPQCFHVWK